MNAAAQARILTRWFVKGSTRVLAVAVAVGAAVSLGLWILATTRGWTTPDVVESEGTAEVIAAFTTTVFSIPLVAAGFGAFVLAIVQTATFSRTMVATGATRAAVAIATLLNGVWMILLVTALAAVVLALEASFAGGWIASTFGLAPGATFADGVPGLLGATGMTALAIVGGMAIAAVFLRWPWWVGVGLLALVLWVIPILAPFVVTEAMASTISAVAALPGTPAVGAVLLAGAYWLVMRRLPVP